VTRKTRSDAEDNRRHVVDVARAAFAADGLDLPMREIARRAGFGVATVYRHFPSRQDLVSAALAAQATRCGEDVRAALADPDSRRALSGLVRRFGERQVSDRGLDNALLGAHPAFDDQRRAHADAFARLVRRAKDDGAVRETVTVRDVRLALTAIAALRTLPADRVATAVRKLTDLLLTGVLRDEPPH
jgi:AcrR family transcriptional regulator